MRIVLDCRVPLRSLAPNLLRLLNNIPHLLTGVEDRCLWLYCGSRIYRVFEHDETVAIDVCRCLKSLDTTNSHWWDGSCCIGLE